MKARFEDKHVSTNAASDTNAAQKSCERNKIGWKWRGKGKKGGWYEDKPSGINTVLFGTTSLEKGSYVNPGTCGAQYPDIFLCTGVPKSYAPSCTTPDPGIYCRSCKFKYPKANTFFVEIDKDNAHLYHEDVWYHDGASWTKFNVATC